MRLLGDRLLLSPLPVQERSAGGIVLPQGQAGDVMMWWKVDQLGSKFSKPEVKVGDTVVTPLHFTHTTLEDGSGRKIVDSDQIHGMLEPEPAPAN